MSGSYVHRDLSSVADGQPLKTVGVLTEHTRPVESLDARVLSDKAAVLYTADTMGIIRVWNITKEGDVEPQWKIEPAGELQVGRRVVHDGGAGGGDALDLAGGELHGVSDDHVGPEHAELAELSNALSLTVH